VCSLIIYYNIGGVCNNASINENGKKYGQATDVALLDVIIKMNMEDEIKVFKINIKKIK
jgi:Ca2+-transporting ATPase